VQVRFPALYSKLFPSEIALLFGNPLIVTEICLVREAAPPSTLTYLPFKFLTLQKFPRERNRS
jgi:hypothetical protein